MLARALDKFLLERLILYTVTDTVSQQIAVGLSGLDPFELEDVGISGQKSEGAKHVDVRINCQEVGMYLSLPRRNVVDISRFRQQTNSYFTLTCGRFGTPPGVLT